METLAPLSICRYVTIRITTGHATEFIDLTGRIDTLVREAGLRCGFVNVQSLHTTVAVVVNEHEPLLLSDFSALLEAAAPSDVSYRHDDMTLRRENLTVEERVNGHAHCRALLLPTSACLNVVDGRIRLGRWQRLFVVELDGPRERELSIGLMGEGAR